MPYNLFSKSALLREFRFCHDTLHTTKLTFLKCQLIVKFRICAEFLDTKSSENDLLKFTLGTEAWGNKTKEIILAQ